MTAATHATPATADDALPAADRVHLHLAHATTRLVVTVTIVGTETMTVMNDVAREALMVVTET